MHAAYRDCFAARSNADDELDSLGAALFSGEAAAASGPDFGEFRFDHVDQGEQAVARVAEAKAAGDAYAVLFLDMRMPPGIDGFETARRIREIDSAINIVVVTGYSDHNPMRIAQVAGPLDRFYYVSKPFRTTDMQQLLLSLAHKWDLDRALRDVHQQLEIKVRQLEEANVEISASEARCRHLALHDPLTRLPNRLYFKNFIDEALIRREGTLAVMYLDLDHFKNVNDSLGHCAGDELICQLGESLRQLLPANSILARLGGDEFGIAMVDTDQAAVEGVGKQVIEVCNQDFEVLGTRVNISGSVGIAYEKIVATDLSEIQRRADLALYSAKHSGRGVVRTFAPDLDESARFRAKVERGLRDALRTDQLSLAYQPIVCPDTGEAYGYEALLRWTDPELGSVPPSIFIPIAEQCGMARMVGEWVIHKALAECARWAEGIVSINISTLHFQSRDFIEYVVTEAARNKLPHDRILLEITETAMFSNPELAAQILIELRQLDLRVALDDFGTGYSSLSNLRDFEIDCIKIDKSFVDSLGQDRHTSAIVSSVAALARLLGLRVVAEGVESVEQVQSLRLMGCGLLQGFYYSKPLVPDDLPYRSAGGDEQQPLPGQAA